MEITKKQTDRAKRVMTRIMTVMCFIDTMKKQDTFTEQVVEASNLFKSKIYTMFDLMDNDPIGFDLIMQIYSNELMDFEIKIDKEILEEVKQLKVKFIKKGIK